MALKDHILKLADGVSKCQENAKSLAQVIFRGLDDIADNLPEHPGGGSDVSVTQVLSSGTKTATITVDDTPTDLYAPTPSAPTDVDVTQVVSTGTKIATITVDNVPTDIYAPSASQDYSTTEHIVGKWIDGTTNVYEKTFTAESVSAGQALFIPHNITGLDTVISLFGGCKTTDRFYPLPFVENDVTYQRYLAVSSTDIIVGNASNAMALTKIVVTIRYTKTS